MDEWNFQYIWPNEYLAEPELALVFVAGIRKKQDIPLILKLINSAFPLPELKHLKRIRRPLWSADEKERLGEAEIIIKFAAQNASADDGVALTDVLGNNSDTSTVFPLLTESVRIVPVSHTRSLTKGQLTVSQALWPTCTANPVVCLETHTFLPQERDIHTGVIRSLWTDVTDTSHLRCLDNRVIITEPQKKQTLYSTSSQTGDTDKVARNPLDHPIMRALEVIASDQRLSSKNEKKDPKSSTHSRSGEEDDTSNDEAAYLCTGCTVYLLREPCVMCGMALIHARVSCVIFIQDAPDDGSLKSILKLQGVKSLNHHFQVWQACPPPAPSDIVLQKIV